jgi:WD40 repeat protein
MFVIFASYTYTCLLTEYLISQEDVDENPYHKLHLEGHEHAVCALTARGRTLVSGSYDSMVRVWDIITGTCRWVLVGHTQKGWYHCEFHDSWSEQSHSLQRGP